MSTKLGVAASEVTLPSPSECKVGTVSTRHQRRMVDGTLRTTNIADNKRWDMDWWGITKANKNTLLTQYNVTGNQNFSPPDEDAPNPPDLWHVVHIVRGTWNEDLQPMAAGILYWVRFSVMET